ncbi:hypothetical protein J6590_062609 [Homalodisca vitripennis]|nr:hypothetical protein J6590_062609 [Homalodisca vitripennis]
MWETLRIPGYREINPRHHPCTRVPSSADFEVKNLLVRDVNLPSWHAFRSVKLNVKREEGVEEGKLRNFCLFKDVELVKAVVLKRSCSWTTIPAEALTRELKQRCFTEDRYTIGAIQDLKAPVNYYSRCFTLLVTFALRNAFKAPSWSFMLNCLEEHLHSFTRRTLTTGAPQGSILDQDLWKISFDGILRIAITLQGLLPRWIR